VGLTDARGAQKEDVGVFSKEASGGQLEDHFAGNSGVKAPVEVLQTFRMPEGSRLGASPKLSLVTDVELILETTIRELIADPNKKFSYVEMKFFSMWFYEQTPKMQDDVSNLVKQGRLEFLNAGWSMSDEACPHFDDLIDNMQKGHDFLMKEFQVRPRVAWHIDPFGHSSATPRVFAEMGFDAWFFARLDYQDKERRMN
jgi:hypothetical protein